MCDDLKFNQAVDTPKGQGTFIGYMMPDGHECLVAQWITRDSKKITVNKIYPSGSVEPRKNTVPAKPKPEPIIQAVDVAFI